MADLNFSQINNDSAVPCWLVPIDLVAELDQLSDSLSELARFVIDLEDEDNGGQVQGAELLWNLSTQLKNVMLEVSSRSLKSRKNRAPLFPSCSVLPQVQKEESDDVLG
jgi:hypothetical protein